jgi:hypothetical protein
LQDLAPCLMGSPVCSRLKNKEALQAQGGKAAHYKQAGGGMSTMSSTAGRPMYPASAGHRSKYSASTVPSVDGHTMTYGGGGGPDGHGSANGYGSTGGAGSRASSGYAPQVLPWDAAHTRVDAPYGIHVPNGSVGGQTKMAGTYLTGMTGLDVAEPMVNTMAAGVSEGDRLEAALDNLHATGELFMGRLRMLSAQQRRRGGQGVVQFATGAQDGAEYAVKFFLQHDAFDQEYRLYSNPALRDMMPAVRYLEGNADGAHRSRNGWPFPPCIVIERGESLDMWHKRIKPDFSTIMQVREPCDLSLCAVVLCECALTCGRCPRSSWFASCS